MSLITIISPPRHITDEVFYLGGKVDSIPGQSMRKYRYKTRLLRQPGQESRKRKTVISFLQAGNQRKRGNRKIPLLPKERGSRVDDGREWPKPQY